MNLVFIMNTSFPYGQAYSSRARHLTKLFFEVGYHVHIIAPESNSIQECIELKNIDYSCEFVHSGNSLATLSGIGTAHPYMKALERYSNKTKIDLVVSSSMVHVTESIRKFCKFREIPYIIEQCEWFDKSSFKFGKFNPYYREHIRSILYKNKKCDGIISISQLLETHYNSQGVPTIRIPTILDANAVEWRGKNSSERKIHIVFAGSLGNGKELLKPIFEALSDPSIDRTLFAFDVYGPSKEQVLQNIGEDHKLMNDLRGLIHIHGRVSQDKIEDILRKADYSIFLRPNRQSSNAGFPTKLAESMMVGTPVITNLTGDIGLYLDDGENGFLTSTLDTKSLVEVFHKILNMDEKKADEMRAKARREAEMFFDYRVYVKQMTDFINNILS